jgi:hypothetical protein
VTQVPASSHGGGLPLTGGTLTGPATIRPANKDDVGLILAPVTGATADATDQLQVLNDTSGFIVEIDAASDIWFTTYAASGGSFRVYRDALEVLRITSSIAWKIATGGAFFVTDHAGNLALTIDEATRVVQAPAGIAANPITSGALPTVAPVTATAFQCSATRDVFLTVPVTYNPGVATTATCLVQLSPDNSTFSTLFTKTVPVGTVFDGQIDPIDLQVPAGWYVKLTVTNAVLGVGTYY